MTAAMARTRQQPTTLATIAHVIRQSSSVRTPPDVSRCLMFVMEIMTAETLPMSNLRRAACSALVNQHSSGNGVFFQSRIPWRESGFPSLSQAKAYLQSYFPSHTPVANKKGFSPSLVLLELLNLELDLLLTDVNFRR